MNFKSIVVLFTLLQTILSKKFLIDTIEGNYLYCFGNIVELRMSEGVFTKNKWGGGIGLRRKIFFGDQYYSYFFLPVASILYREKIV